jgi:cyclophilin family peptidyl-prolyl cis-trans isomerase
MRRVAAVLAGPIAAGLLFGCGGSATANDPGEPNTAPSMAAAGCVKVKQPEPKDIQLHKPHLRVNPTKRYDVTLQTNCGPIAISLDVGDQPRTAASFLWLVRQGFYDGLTFHRIAHAPNGSDFVIQGGDPHGDGSGTPGYTITEQPPSDAHYTRGVVAMAKTANEPPGTSGSQFFIVTARNAGLPPDYALVGHVTRGMKTVKRIASVPTNPHTERPRQPIVIQHADATVRG